jgi:hypothetical protein
MGPVKAKEIGEPFGRVLFDCRQDR